MSATAKKSRTPDPTPSVEHPSPVTRMIAIADIDLDGANHRLSGPQTKARLQELVNSLRDNGQQQPIRVYAKPSDDPSPKGLLLGFGFRRVAAASLLGWTQIRADVLPMPAYRAEIERDRAVENLHRQDLNPMEEALAVAQLLESLLEESGQHEVYWDGTRPLPAAFDAVANMLGRSARWVRDRAYLQRLSKRVQKMVIDGKLLLGHAREIAKLADTDYQETVAKSCELSEEGTTGVGMHQVRQWVQHGIRSLRIVPWHLDQPFAGRVACSGCPNNSSNDKSLFEHDQETPEGTCLLQSCFEAKQNAAEKAKQKAVEKIVNKSMPATETTAREVAPEWLKPAAVAREAKKQAGAGVEREALPKTSSAPATKRTPQKEAAEKLEAALAKWEGDTLNLAIQAAEEKPERILLLALMIHHPGFDPYAMTDEARRGNAILFKEAIADPVEFCSLMVEHESFVVPLLDDGEASAECLAVLVEAWKIDAPAMPRLEDFLPASSPVASEKAKAVRAGDTIAPGQVAQAAETGAAPFAVGDRVVRAKNAQSKETPVGLVVAAFLKTETHILWPGGVENLEFTADLVKTDRRFVPNKGGDQKSSWHQWCAKLPEGVLIEAGPTWARLYFAGKKPAEARAEFDAWLKAVTAIDGKPRTPECRDAVNYFGLGYTPEQYAAMATPPAQQEASEMDAQRPEDGAAATKGEAAEGGPVELDGPVHPSAVGIDVDDLIENAELPDLRAGKIGRIWYLHGTSPYCLISIAVRRPNKAFAWHLHPLILATEYKGKTRDYEPAGDYEGIIVTAPTGRDYVMGDSKFKVTLKAEGRS